MEDIGESEHTPIILAEGSRPPIIDNRPSQHKKIAVYLILVSTVLERLAFYALSINLIVNLRSPELGWNPSNSAKASFIFFGISYISSVIFATISDARLGRAKTIITGFVIYLIGYIMILLLAEPNSHHSVCSKTTAGGNASIVDEYCGIYIVITLVLVAIGVGAVQANVAVFGAEQQSKTLSSSYFDQYYTAVNIGGMIATLCIPLVQTDQSDGMTNSYFNAYFTAFWMLVFSAVLFLLGYTYYIHIKADEAVLLKWLPILINACGTKCQKFEDTEEMDSNVHIDSYLDYAKTTNRGHFTPRQVNDVKAFHRALIVFSLLLPYWLIYAQLQITFTLQGQQMKIPSLPNKSPMPANWMSLGDSITVIVGLGILNFIVYPLWPSVKKILSIKKKLVLGMILAACSMFAAGIVEVVRSKDCSNDSSETPVELSIFIQLPQNICMGLAEIFASVGSLEFAYSSAPRSGQSLFMSLHFFSRGIASFLGIGYIHIYRSSVDKFDFKCTSKPNNHWVYEPYFFILGALQIGFLLITLLCDRYFNLFRRNPENRR